MKVLIGYDGSECADKALDDLKRAGLPKRAEAIVLSVADIFRPPASPEAYREVEKAFDRKIQARAQELSKKAAEAVEQARAMAIEASRRVQEHFPAWSVKAEAVGDSPAWAIIKKAGEWGADLIVVGSHGRSAAGRLLLGSVSQKVVNEAPCSVRIGRGRKRESDAPLRILIGVDGSPGAEAALNAVAAREWPGGTEARAVAVPDLMMVTLIEWVEEGDEDDRAWVRRMVAASAEKLQGAGLETSSGIRNGDAKRVLISEARKWGADTVFVGARGLRRIERFLLGSVSAAVAARAHCSVEVVRKK